MTTQLHIPTDIDLTQFISKEAHDLKSPFNRTLGFMKLVIKGMDGPIPDQAHEDLIIAYQNSQYALQLVSGLIEIARLNLGERKVSLSRHTADTIIHNAINEWRKGTSRNPVPEVHFSPLQANIMVDEMLFPRCLATWIAYTLLFTEGEGKVMISAETKGEYFQFLIQSIGKRLEAPAEADLNLNGYIASQLLNLHHGALLKVEENETGAEVWFQIPDR